MITVKCLLRSNDSIFYRKIKDYRKMSKNQYRFVYQNSNFLLSSLINHLVMIYLMILGSSPVWELLDFIPLIHMRNSKMLIAHWFIGSSKWIQSVIGTWDLKLMQLRTFTHKYFNILVLLYFYACEYFFDLCSSVSLYCRAMMCNRG